MALKDARASKKVHTKELVKSGKSRKEASKILAPEYAGILLKTSKIKEGWQSSATSVEIKHYRNPCADRLQVITGLQYK